MNDEKCKPSIWIHNLNSYVFFLKSSSNFHENGDELDDESYHNDYSHTKYLANYNLLKLSSFYLGK